MVYQTKINRGTTGDKLTLNLPNMAVTTTEKRYKEASNKLKKTFNLSKWNFEFNFVDMWDLWGMLGATAKVERKLVNVPKDTDVWICRSNEKWLLLPESPVNMDKWKVVDEFFQAALGIKEDGLPQVLTDEEKKEIKQLEVIKEMPFVDNSKEVSKMINEALGPVGSTHTDESGNQSSQEPTSTTDYSSGGGTFAENRGNLIKDTTNHLHKLVEREKKKAEIDKEAQAYLKYLEMEYQDDFGETEEIDYSVETVEIGNSTSWDGYEDVD